MQASTASPITTPDGGDATANDASTDQVVIADGGDAAGTPDDGPAIVTDGGTDASADLPVCERAGYDAGFCGAGTTCVPNLYDPTCSRATACDCDMADAALDPLLCTVGSNLAACRAAVTCSPGHNHCSPHLPMGVEYAPVTSLEPRNGHGGLARLLTQTGTQTGYRRSDMTSGSTNFYGGRVYNRSGFVEICHAFPSAEIDPLDGIPPELAGQSYCAECAGSTCYWNRGSLMLNGPSVEITIGQDGCSIEVRIYINGSSTPARTRNYYSLSSSYC